MALSRDNDRAGLLGWNNNGTRLVIAVMKCWRIYSTELLDMGLCDATASWGGNIDRRVSLDARTYNSNSRSYMHGWIRIDVITGELADSWFSLWFFGILWANPFTSSGPLLLLILWWRFFRTTRGIQRKSTLSLGIQVVIWAFSMLSMLSFKHSLSINIGVICWGNIGSRF